MSKHQMSEPCMEWKPIDTIPDDGKLVLVGFKGQFEWFYFVAPANGVNTGKYMPYAPPTHWTKIQEPNE